MSEHVTIDSTRFKTFEHPAIAFWTRTGKVHAESITVETLQAKKQRTVYRLKGAGPSGAAVIAKRCFRVEAITECTIYEKVLSRLPFPALRTYGVVEEEDSDFAWLFIEDAGGEEYLPLHNEHRALAGRWLGVMHTEASSLINTASLPDRGLKFYMEYLRPICEMILINLSNPSLNADDVIVLEKIVLQCKTIESHYSQLKQFCDRIPKTLVHGSFIGRNFRIRSDPIGQNSLIVFDWGSGGWGIPARDIAKLNYPSTGSDIAFYSSVVQKRWRSLDVLIIQRLRCVGEMFRQIEHYWWEVQALQYEWLEKMMRKLRLYQIWMDKLIQQAPWVD